MVGGAREGECAGRNEWTPDRGTGVGVGGRGAGQWQGTGRLMRGHPGEELAKRAGVAVERVGGGRGGAGILLRAGEAGMAGVCRV